MGGLSDEGSAKISLARCDHVVVAVEGYLSPAADRACSIVLTFRRVDFGGFIRRLFGLTLSLSL